MTELLAILVPLLLIDILNPVLLAALIYAAGSSRPIANSGSLLLGHTLAYVVVGLLISVGLEALGKRLANPEPMDFLLEFLLGLACLYGAFASRDGSVSEERNPEGELTPFKCLAFGVIINIIGAPFALPYFAVISQIVDADLSVSSAVVVLSAYNFAYALPFAAVPLSVFLVGDRAQPGLQRVNALMARGADMLMPWMLLAIGMLLLTDVGVFLLCGKPLSFD
ncbi:MAG: GAP family protein [Halioglobus sp.]